MTQYPPSIYEVLTLIKSGCKWCSDMPEGLMDALQVAIAEGLVSSTDLIRRAETGKPDSLLLLTVAGSGALSWRALEESKPTKDELPPDGNTRNGDIVLPARLTVSLEAMSITLDGTTHDVDSKQALRWIKVLADHPGEWISSAELSNYDGELLDVRPDRLRQKLPVDVKALIESNKSKGSRLRLP